MTEIMGKLTLLMEHANITRTAAKKAEDEYHAALVAAASFKVGDLVSRSEKVYRIVKILPSAWALDQKPKIDDDDYDVYGELRLKDGSFGAVHRITYGWQRLDGGAA